MLKVFNGHKVLFEETFVSPVTCSSYESALCKLDDIRSCHPESKGWFEVESNIEKVDNGWKVSRHHVKVE